MNTHYLALGIISFISLSIPSASWATVATLEQIQAANPNVDYQFTFEGATDADKLDQKVTPFSPDLITYKNTAAFAGNVTYGAGYDISGAAFSAAGTLSGGSRPTGAAMKTSADITLATSGTIEYLVRANSINDNGFAIGGVAGANRYYFMFNGPTGSNAAYTNLTTSSGGSLTLMGGATSVAYETGDWYYVAQTWSIAAGNVTVNAWVANLTDNGSLTQTITNAVGANNGSTTYTLRLGSNGDANNFFNGGFDAFAIYDSALSSATIADHFAAIPEPSTAALLGLAALGALVRRRSQIGS